jgi:hypothetical protein
LGLLPPRRSGAETCGGGPGSIKVDDLAVEAVLMQVTAGRLDPACRASAAGLPRLEPGARISRSIVLSVASSSVA